MKDLAVLTLLLLAIIGSSLVAFLGGKAVAWFFRQKECDQIEIAIQLLLIIVGLAVLILQSF